MYANTGELFCVLNVYTLEEVYADTRSSGEYWDDQYLNNLSPDSFQIRISKQKKIDAWNLCVIRLTCLVLEMDNNQLI